MPENPYSTAFITIAILLMLAGAVISVARIIKNPLSLMNRRKSFDRGDAIILRVSAGVMVVGVLAAVIYRGSDLVSEFNKIFLGFYTTMFLSLWIRSLVSSLGLGNIITGAGVLLLSWLADKAGYIPAWSKDNGLLYTAIGIVLGVLLPLLFRRKDGEIMADKI